jgi:deoxyuridine 5'-triphosphate nucleotidohydrolase
MRREVLLVKKLSASAVLPSRGSALAAGFDLSSAHECIIPAHGKAIVKTDLAIAIPSGCYARVAPRSGLSWKNHLDIGAGVIDEDYRGNVGVVIFNHANEDFHVKHGDRIAQLILERIASQAVVEEVEDLNETARGDSGFGSTGVAKRTKIDLEEVDAEQECDNDAMQAVIDAITAVESGLSEGQRQNIKKVVMQADERQFALLQKASVQYSMTGNKQSFMEWIHAVMQEKS